MIQRTAVVIGATRNLGLYIAQELAKRGWSVVGVGRSVPQDACGVRFVVVDLTQPNAVHALTSLLWNTAPALIVSNAVTYGPEAPEDVDLAAFEDMFRVNTIVPYLAISGYLNSTAAAGASCIIINSDSMFHANRRVGPYAASKAALKVLTTALADTCRAKGCAVATLLLGPLADCRKMSQCATVAEKNGVAVEVVVKALLKKGNPFYLMESFIGFDECFRSIEYIFSLGTKANGMVCKLDGGASGSLY